MNTNKTELFNELVTLLEDQIRVYRSLLDVVRHEKDILVSADLDELNENNRTKEAMLIKVRSMEAQRIKVASDLSQVLGLDPTAPRLLELARVLEGEPGERLRSLHSVMELLLKRVQEHNKSNEVLVKSALENITGAMKAIRDTLQDKPTYKRQGEVTAAPASSGQLVRKEA